MFFLYLQLSDTFAVILQTEAFTFELNILIMCITHQLKLCCA